MKNLNLTLTEDDCSAIADAIALAVVVEIGPRIMSEEAFGEIVSRARENFARSRKKIGAERLVTILRTFAPEGCEWL